MSLPSIVGTPATTAGGTASSSPVFNLPTGIRAGDLLLLVHSYAGGVGATPPSGWADVRISTTGAPTTIDLHVAHRVADGTEGATVTLSLSASNKFAGICYRVRDHGVKVVSASQNTPGDILVTTGDPGGTSANPDPPQLTASALDDYLWFAAEGNNGTATVTTYPTGYTYNQQNIASGGSGGVTTKCVVGVGARQLNALSEDPSAFTINASADWAAGVVAVPGANYFYPHPTVPFMGTAGGPTRRR